MLGAFDCNSTMRACFAVLISPDMTELFLIPRRTRPKASIHILLVWTQLVHNLPHNASINFWHVLVKSARIVYMIDSMPGNRIEDCLFEMLPRVFYDIKTRLIVFMQNHVAPESVPHFSKLFDKHGNRTLHFLHIIPLFIVFTNKAGHVSVISFIFRHYSSDSSDSIVQKMCTRVEILRRIAKFKDKIIARFGRPWPNNICDG